MPSTAPIGITPPPRPLPRQMRSGLDAEPLDGQERAGAPAPGLDLVGAQQPVVLPAQRLQRREEGRRRLDDSARPEDRLDDDAGDVGRVDRVEEQVVADVVDGRVTGAARPRLPEGAAVGVGIRHVHEAGHDGPDAATQLGDLGAERDRHRRLPVVAAEEAEDQRPAGGPAHQPDRDLDGLGAVEGDVDAGAARRRDSHEALGQRRDQLGGDGVGVLVAVAGHRGTGRPRGSGGGRRPAAPTRRAGHVEEQVAVEVLDDEAGLAGDDDRRGVVAGPAVEHRRCRARAARLRGPGGR